MAIALLIAVSGCEVVMLTSLVLRSALTVAVGSRELTALVIVSAQAEQAIDGIFNSIVCILII